MHKEGFEDACVQQHPYLWDVVQEVEDLVERAEAGIFDPSFDRHEDGDGLSLVKLVVAMIRQHVLDEAQKKFSLVESTSGTSSFWDNDATVHLFLPRCDKYSSAPRNIYFTGRLGKLFQHPSFRNVVRNLNMGVALDLASSSSPACNNVHVEPMSEG